MAGATNGDTRVHPNVITSNTHTRTRTVHGRLAALLEPLVAVLTRHGLRHARAPKAAGAAVRRRSTDR